MLLVLPSYTTARANQEDPADQSHSCVVIYQLGRRECTPRDCDTNSASRESVKDTLRVMATTSLDGGDCPCVLYCPKSIYEETEQVHEKQALRLDEVKGAAISAVAE